MSKKVANRILRAMLHLLLEVKYSSLEMTLLLRNAFYCLFLRLKTEQDQVLPSDIISLAKFGSNLGYEYGPIIILATFFETPCKWSCIQM